MKQSRLTGKARQSTRPIRGREMRDVAIMARPARIEYEGAFYHVMNRGNRREDIFLDDNDRQKFYKILGTDMGLSYMYLY